MGPEASIDKAADNPKGDAQNVCDPVAHVGAAVKSWLDEFNEAAEGTRPHKHRRQSNAPSSCQAEESAAKAMRWTTLSLPSGAGGGGFLGAEHRDRQNEGSRRGASECRGTCIG